MNLSFLKQIKPKEGKRKHAIFFILTLIISLVAATYFSLTTDIPFFQSISIGILSSLIASFVSIIVFQTFNLNDTEINTELNSIKYLIENHLIEKRFQDEGILSISTKDAHKPEFWKSLLLNCNQELSLMGHSLNTWFKTPYNEVFYETLRKLAKNDKEVRIIMFLPMHSSICKISKEHTKYKDGIIKTLELLYDNVIDKIDATKKKNIVIRLAPYCSIHNMIFITDDYLCISPYNRFFPNYKNILFQLKRLSPIANSFSDDYEEVFKADSTIPFSVTSKAFVKSTIESYTKVKKTNGNSKK
jgi:hypothetical protein